MSEPEKSIEEIGAALIHMADTWDTAPCRLRIYVHGQQAEAMAWKRELSESEKRTVDRWAMEKYDNKATLLWDGAQNFLAQ
jgi:hypothetical protein